MRLPLKPLIMIAMLLGVPALFYCANMAAFAAWLNAHPNYDDAYWGRRAMFWGGVFVATLVTVRVTICEPASSATAMEARFRSEASVENPSPASELHVAAALVNTSGAASHMYAR